MPNPPVLHWLNPNLAALRARTSRTTILRALRSGELKGWRVGGRGHWRMRPEAVDAWIMGAQI
jgi:excisionase family DNA binding protein